MPRLYNNKFPRIYYYYILQIYTILACLYICTIIIIDCILGLNGNQWRELKSWYGYRQRISAINEYFARSGAYPIVSRAVDDYLQTALRTAYDAVCIIILYSRTHSPVVTQFIYLDFYTRFFCRNDII